MRTENVVLMRMAKESLAGKWGLAIGTFIVLLIVLGGISGISTAIFPASGLISMLIAGPMAIGVAIFSLNLSRNQDARLEQIFMGFKNFANALGAYVLMLIFITLWSLLLIIPGIIAAISYSMTFYIMAEDESINPMDALKKSKEMMYGYKAKYFWLSLRFFLWSLLCILTLGIGFLWLMPWASVTTAKFYDDIKDHPIAKV